jgi:hypothetical protein
MNAVILILAAFTVLCSLLLSWFLVVCARIRGVERAARKSNAAARIRWPENHIDWARNAPAARHPHQTLVPPSEPSYESYPHLHETYVAAPGAGPAIRKEVP